jgi:transcription antitermination factor NusG
MTGRSMNFLPNYDCIVKKTGFMSENKKWYAVYTRPRWEKKVADNLTRGRIENYCPLNKVMRQWSDRKKVIHEPLFTSYVFVKVTEKEHLQLKKTDGVINLVYWLNKPAVIPDHEIDTIKRFLNEHMNVALQKKPVNVTDMVRVVGGPLIAQEGQVLSVKSRTVKIALPSLGYMMYAEVDTANVEVIPNTTIIHHADLNYPLSAAK